VRAPGNCHAENSRDERSTRQHSCDDAHRSLPSMHLRSARRTTLARNKPSGSTPRATGKDSGRDAPSNDTLFGSISVCGRCTRRREPRRARNPPVLLGDRLRLVGVWRCP
jgi:hypothetical protein